MKIPGFGPKTAPEVSLPPVVEQLPKKPKLTNIEFDCGCKFERSWRTINDYSFPMENRAPPKEVYSVRIHICEDHIDVLGNITPNQMLQTYLDKSHVSDAPRLGEVESLDEKPKGDQAKA